MGKVTYFLLIFEFTDGLQISEFNYLLVNFAFIDLIIQVKLFDKTFLLEVVFLLSLVILTWIEVFQHLLILLNLGCLTLIFTMNW